MHCTHVRIRAVERLRGRRCCRREPVPGHCGCLRRRAPPPWLPARIRSAASLRWPERVTCHRNELVKAPAIFCVCNFRQTRAKPHQAIAPALAMTLAHRRRRPPRHLTGSLTPLKPELNATINPDPGAPVAASAPPSNSRRVELSIIWLTRSSSSPSAASPTSSSQSAGTPGSGSARGLANGLIGPAGAAAADNAPGCCCRGALGSASEEGWAAPPLEAGVGMRHRMPVGLPGAPLATCTAV